MNDGVSMTFALQHFVPSHADSIKKSGTDSMRSNEKSRDDCWNFMQIKLFSFVFFAPMPRAGGELQSSIFGSNKQTNGFEE